MRASDAGRCTNCRRLQARVDALEAELAALKQVVAQLGQQLAASRKDSSTSSKPPSSDIVKPPKSPPPRVVQQVDIREVALSVQEHRSHAGWCPRCQKMHEAPLPPGIAHGGLVGPSLTALIAYLKGACHASFSTVRKFLRDVVGVTISRGELARIIGKVSRALERPDQELLDDLPGQSRLNVDETGHEQSGDRQWTWCFRDALYTLFKIDPTRSG